MPFVTVDAISNNTHKLQTTALKTQYLMYLMCMTSQTERFCLNSLYGDGCDLLSFTAAKVFADLRLLCLNVTTTNKHRGSRNLIFMIMSAGHIDKFENLNANSRLI